MTFLRKKVKGVPRLSVIKLPLYIPTDVGDTLPELSHSLSIEEMISSLNAKHASEPISDTLFDSLRETNAVPHLLQAQVLRSIRTSCEADLESLDAEIQRLHSKISDLSLALSVLTTKRVRTQDISRSCSSWLSPLRRLPPEVFGEISIHCLPSHRRPIATEAPLLLTHVCSAWRRTVLGFPFLWSHLFLKYNSNLKHATTSKMSKIMDLWFNHASNTPLTFHLNLKYGRNGKRDEKISNVMVNHANRFRKLHVSLTKVDFIERFMTRTPGRLKMLESLQLEIGYLDIADAIITVFDKAPLLRKVILNLGAVGLVPPPNLPWKQLTNISIVGTATYQVSLLYILRECKQIVSGWFTITTGEGDGEIARVFGANPVVLEYLVDLKVSLSVPGDFAERFSAIERLSLPRLTHFSLMGDCDEYTHLSYISLLGALRRAPKLQHFTLLDFSKGPEDLLPILQSIPRLTFLKLALKSEGEYNSFIKAMRCVDGQSSIYVPLLETLDMRVESTLDVLNVNELMEMVRSRRNTSIQSSQSPVGYLNLRLHLSEDILLIKPGFAPEIDLLKTAQITGEIEISAYHIDDDDDYNSISLDLP